ncbi:AsmA family protein [Desulforhopalus sp. 52FAK]
MKNIFKYGVVPLVVGTFLLCITAMLLPALINVQKFLPQIEKQISQHTGRTFSVGSDFGLTFFPWLSVTFSDMHLGNPEGVGGDDFIEIDSFEARLKILPLLINKVEVSRFVVSGLNINLRREPGGETNWEMFHSKNSAPDRQTRTSHLSWIFDRDVAVELLAVTGGKITYVDKNIGTQHVIEDLMVLLNEVSSTEKAKADIKGVVDGYKVRATGDIGPVSAGLGSLATDLRLEINERIKANVNGECTYPLDSTTCDLKVSVPRFALDNVFVDGQGGEDDNDGSVLSGQVIELEGQFLGNIHTFTLKSGSGVIDNTSFTYELSHDSQSDVINEIDVRFNTLDLDRYFSESALGNTAGNGEKEHPVLNIVKSTPFTAHITAEELSLAEVLFNDVDMQLSVVDGVVEVGDGTFVLHGGRGSFNAVIGLDKEPVSMNTHIELSEVQAEPFSKELIGASFISGVLSGNLNLKRSDIAGSDIGKAFVGQGYLEIDGGMISGLQLLKDDTEGDVVDESGDYSFTTDFEKFSANLAMGAGVIYLQPFTLSADGINTVMSAVIELDEKSFSISPEKESADEEVLSIMGSYGSEGLAVNGFTDEHETTIHEMRDAQTLVDEKMPAPVEEDVPMVGTPLIDPAIVAERFGLRPELIKPSKKKKAYNVGRGRVIIHDLKELNSSIFVE